MFSRVAWEYSVAGCSFFFSAKCTKFSQYTYLILMVFFYTFWRKTIFFMFLGGIKKTSVMKCVNKHFFCVDDF